MLSSMLALDDPRWETLASCYGERPVAGLLQRLLIVSLPLDLEKNRPTLWDELFNELYHQGTLYPATIAATPHLFRFVARMEPGQRMDWLAMIANIEAMRTLGNVYDPQGQITSDLMMVYEQALRDGTTLVQEAIAARTGQENNHSESSMAKLLSLLAFASGERRLGYLLARWWPYAEIRPGEELIPVVGLEQYEEMTGDLRDRG